jgi:hypothetical protein
MDKAQELTFVSALSKEEVAKGSRQEVFLVSAAQVGVCLPTLHISMPSSFLIPGFSNLSIPCSVHVNAQSRCHCTRKSVLAEGRSTMQMAVETPYRATRMAPIRALEALSSRILQATLKACMGPYLDRLIVDYSDWAEGRARRQERIEPTEAAKLFLEAEGAALDGLESTASPDKATGNKSTDASGANQTVSKNVPQ